MQKYISMLVVALVVAVMSTGCATVGQLGGGNGLSGDVPKIGQVIHCSSLQWGDAGARVIWEAYPESMKCEFQKVQVLISESYFWPRDLSEGWFLVVYDGETGIRLQPIDINGAK